MAVVVSIGVFTAFIVVDDDADEDFAVAVVPVVVSVSVACFSIGVFVALVVFDDDDDDFAVVVVQRFSVSAFLEGDFFFFPITWVHPSPSLSGWSPASGCGLSFIGGMIFAAIVVVVVVVAVVFVGGVTVVLVVFWGQDLEKCPSCLQNQHWGFLPSTTTIIVCSS